MYSDDDSYVDGAAAFSERSATLPAGSDVFISTCRSRKKDAFCERFSVRLLTSYGMTETIVGIIGDRPGDKRRWHVDWSGGLLLRSGDPRRSQSSPSRLVSSVKSVLKAYQGKTIFKEYFLNPKATAKVLEADGWLHTGDTGYRDEEGFFLFRRSPLQYDQTRWRECLLRGARKYHRHPSKKFRISWLWVLKIRFAMKPSKHLWY